jgi:hypothetical protein
MLRWQTACGVLIGLAAGLVILALVGGAGRGRPPAGPILSECDGHLRELVIQYERSAKEIVTTTYREFLGALDADVTVRVVCPDQAAYDELNTAVGPVKCRLSPIIVNHPITTWSRDRWVGFAPGAKGGPAMLWCPRGENADGIWPARAGDEQVATDIAAALAPKVTARRAGLYFDGGDFMADASNVFVVPRVLQRNIQHSVVDSAELVNVFSNMFKRRVVLLDEAPEHHAAMFMASVGNNTMLVGDPSLARQLAQPDGCGSGISSVDTNFPGGPDFTPETQHLFDAVAHQCAAAGYKVVRVPVVPGSDGRTYVTYCNVIMDEKKDGRRVVYLPQYRDIPSLNRAARGCWESLGFEVRPVDCSDTFRHFGCLHCLVNVVRRG